MKQLFTFVALFYFVAIANSQSNQYLHFDGNDDYVNISDLAPALNNTNQISMTGWFKKDALRYGAGLMGIRGGGTGDTMYLVELSNGTVECRLIINGTMFEVVAPSGSLEANVWKHFAWIYTGTKVKLYIDGNLIGEHNAQGNFSGIDKPFAIGRSVAGSYNFYYNGSIDEISVWNVALTQSQIQTMMTDELNGNESGLLAYYKFNQGIPGEDNRFITELKSKTNNHNGELVAFALQGNSSNFLGTITPPAQSINFPLITNKVITDPPFALQAHSSSGLPVTYSIVSGPATLSGNTVTLNGTEGTVVIEATQAGNANYDPADPVQISFEVLDPANYLPQIEILNPIGDTALPSLSAIPIAVYPSIEHPELFSVSSFDVSINNQSIALTNHNNNFYTGWWTPQQYGTQQIEITAQNNYGNSITTNQSFNLINTATNSTVNVASNVLLNSDIPAVVVEANLPSFVGAYNHITGNFSVACPSAGCDPWDMISKIELQGHDGKWHEIIRYITPYRLACSHQIDLTDFESLLQGKVKFRLSLSTNGTGYLYNLSLDYQAGTPTYKYSKVQDLWTDTYPFGDMANLQPCETYDIDFDPNVEAGKIKLVSTGHGWGQNNTGNAAEFHHDTHHIWVNGVQTFTQDNWLDCNPNPDGCQPQHGTWYYDRAGWCPGSIAPWFDFEFSNLDVNQTMSLKYIFNPNYVDYCHPNNPDCVSGVTCSNCNDGYNPVLVVASHLITFSDTPFNDNQITLGEIDINGNELNNFDFKILPNPNNGIFAIATDEENMDEIIIYDFQGREVKHIKNDKIGDTCIIDISNESNGIYVIKVINKKGSSTKKFIKIF